MRRGFFCQRRPRYVHEGATSQRIDSSELQVVSGYLFTCCNEDLQQAIVIAKLDEKNRTQGSIVLKSSEGRNGTTRLSVA